MLGVGERLAKCLPSFRKSDRGDYKKLPTPLPQKRYHDHDHDHGHDYARSKQTRPTFYTDSESSAEE